MNENGVEKTRSRCPVWIWALLGVSLLVNVAVLGIILGFQMKDRSEPTAANRQIEWVLRLVPEDRRDFTKDHFRSVREQLRSLRVERRDMLDDIISAVRAEPFSPDAVAKALEGRRVASARTRTIVHVRLVELMEAFTPEERALFADRLEDRVNKWRQASGN